MKKLLYTNKKGQALTMALLLIPFLITLAHQTIRFSRFVERKITLQNGVDAAILSGGTVLADGLNKISELNKKLNRYHKLLTFLKMGMLVYSNAGLLLSQKAIKARMKTIIAEQDFIKNSYPILATEKALIMARKNKTPHVRLSPLFYRYAIHRIPWRIPRHQIPGPYELDSNFQSKNKWIARGIYYRGAYRAAASIRLVGKDLSSPHWRGDFIE